MRKKSLIAFLFLCGAFFASAPLANWFHHRKTLSSYPYFRDNPHLTDAERTLIAPHLLPLNHPLKPTLDTLFSHSRVTQNQESLIDAGFSIIASMPGSFVIVARHPQLPGHVLKLYLDTETRCKEAIPNCQWLAKRCIGAKIIRNIIEKNRFKHFVIPDKWLYILPENPLSNGPIVQPIILIENDMELASEEESNAAWRTQITQEHLKELHAILKHGYGTIRVAENIPYTIHGTFAFTDTEYPHRKLKLRKVSPYLSLEMQQEWERLAPTNLSRKLTQQNRKIN